jgi:hypothetical protein
MINDFRIIVNSQKNLVHFSAFDTFLLGYEILIVEIVYNHKPLGHNFALKVINDDNEMKTWDLFSVG